MPESAIDLPALHRVAALHLQLAVVGVGRDPAVGVADQHEVAVALQLVAGIDHGAVLGRLDRRAFRHREVDAVVPLAVRLLAEAGDDAAAHRPAEAGSLGGARLRSGRRERPGAAGLRRERDLLLGGRCGGEGVGVRRRPAAAAATAGIGAAGAGAGDLLRIEAGELHARLRGCERAAAARE